MLDRLRPLVCWLLHQRYRQILLRGSHPLGLDDVVFCERCGSTRGHGVRALQLAPVYTRAR